MPESVGFVGDVRLRCVLGRTIVSIGYGETWAFELWVWLSNRNFLENWEAHKRTEERGKVEVLTKELISLWWCISLSWILKPEAHVSYRSRAASFFQSLFSEISVSWSSCVHDVCWIALCWRSAKLIINCCIVCAVECMKLDMETMLKNVCFAYFLVPNMS